MLDQIKKKYYTIEVLLTILILMVMIVIYILANPPANKSSRGYSSDPNLTPGGRHIPHGNGGLNRNMNDVINEGK